MPQAERSVLDGRVSCTEDKIHREKRIPGGRKLNRFQPCLIPLFLDAYKPLTVVRKIRFYGRGSLILVVEIEPCPIRFGMNEKLALNAS